MKVLHESLTITVSCMLSITWLNWEHIAVTHIEQEKFLQDILVTKNWINVWYHKVWVLYPQQNNEKTKLWGLNSYGLLYVLWEFTWANKCWKDDVSLFSFTFFCPFLLKMYAQGSRNWHVWKVGDLQYIRAEILNWTG